MSSPLRMPDDPEYICGMASDVSWRSDNNNAYPPMEYNINNDYPEELDSIAMDVPWRDNNNAYIQEVFDGSIGSNVPWRDNNFGSIGSNVQWRDNINAYLPPEFCSITSNNVRWRDKNNVYAPVQSLQFDGSTDEISKIVTTMNDQYLIFTVPATRSSISKPWTTICQVPNHLRNAHEHGFHPNLISIGPFHRHQPHLAAMEGHKTRFLLRLLNSMKLNGTTSTTLDESAESSDQAITTTNTKKIEYLAVKMNELQANAKACYSPASAFNNSSYLPHNFVIMLILDGCFVVELLRLYAKCDKENDDPIFSTRWMLPKLQHDLLLFENQLPYFVLEKIFEITSSEEEKRDESLSLARLALNFFDPLLPREKKLLEKCTLDAKPDHHHLLGLFRSSFVSSFKDRKSTTSIRQADNNHRNSTASASIIDVPPAAGKRQLIHCVSELKEAGIIFKKSKNHGLLDIEFKNGKLYIPPLSIDDHTSPVFLNFIAYEQCNINAEPYFTHYFLFLDSLLNSSKDVEHLHHRGIIDHVLGSDEDVADLFNKLCKEVVHDVNNCYLSQVLKDVNKYFRIKRHRWWATWKHDYFRNPWAISSFLAAILLILLTAIQSFFSVYAYFLPPSNK